MRPRVLTPVYKYNRQHLRSIHGPDDLQKISRSLVGTKNIIPRRRKNTPSIPETTSSSEDDDLPSYLETTATEFDFDEFDGMYNHFTEKSMQPITWSITKNVMKYFL